MTNRRARLRLSQFILNQFTPSCCQDDEEELKKRVAVLECQLRKSEAAKKGFEMSTGKLLSFVEVKRSSLDPSTAESSPLQSPHRQKPPVTQVSLNYALLEIESKCDLYNVPILDLCVTGCIFTFNDKAPTN